MEVSDPQSTAELYMDVMAGVRFSVLNPHSRNAILDEETAKVINKKLKQVTELFIKAYKKAN
ncbi:hypothetical protein D3C78_1508500 [compost metagenome]